MQPLSVIRWAGWSRWPMPEPIRSGCRALACWTAPFCRAPAARRSTSRCRDGSTNSIASAEREPSAFQTIEEAAQRLSTRNKRLTPALALHLARHGVRQDADGLYRWKFDHHLRARAPYRLSPDDYIGLWSRITCPTLLMWGDESFLPDPEAAGLLAHFKQAELQKIAGAGHWLHHDRLDVVLASLRRFLGATRLRQRTDAGGRQRHHRTMSQNPGENFIRRAGRSGQ